MISFLLLKILISHKGLVKDLVVLRTLLSKNFNFFFALITARGIWIFCDWLTLVLHINIENSFWYCNYEIIFGAKVISYACFS